MTNEERQWHTTYEQLPSAERKYIDQAFTAAKSRLAKLCTPAQDDRAESLIAAITKYYFDSK